MMVMDGSVKHPTRAGGNSQKSGGNSGRRSGEHCAPESSNTYIWFISSQCLWPKAPMKTWIWFPPPQKKSSQSWGKIEQNKQQNKKYGNLYISTNCHAMKWLNYQHVYHAQANILAGRLRLFHEDRCLPTIKRTTPTLWPVSCLLYTCRKMRVGSRLEAGMRRQ